MSRADRQCPICHTSWLQHGAAERARCVARWIGSAKEATVRDVGRAFGYSSPTAAALVLERAVGMGLVAHHPGEQRAFRAPE